jgi:ribonuclease HI
VTEETKQIDGLVLYTDGSFRRQRAGWGVHGYAFVNEPLKQGIGVKQLPTAGGYEIIALTETVTPTEYIDAFGNVLNNPTNNTAELQAAIEAFKIAEQYPTTMLVLRMDSEYVRKGLTGYVKTWAKNNWVKADGTPVANQDYWKELVAAHQAWEAAGKKVDFKWVKGHSGELGNESADTNALMGSGTIAPDCIMRTPPAGYHKPLVECHPLIMRKRVLTCIGPDAPPADNYYYMYHLRRGHTYGQKQGDSAKDRMLKTDLILGRRIAEATFGVFKANEPEVYIETLRRYHEEAHKSDVTELAVLLLDNALRPGIFQRVQQLKNRSLLRYNDIQAMVTPHDDLISKTLTPPRMAYEAIGQFDVMRRRLDQFLDGQLGDGVTVVDITESFYGLDTTGKKSKTKLHKTITSNTPLVEVEAVVRGVKTKLRMVLGLDLPDRNQLAKLADLEPTVHLLVVADGPVSYSYSTVFKTAEGTALYQSPYTQFVLPR